MKYTILALPLLLLVSCASTAPVAPGQPSKTEQNIQTGVTITDGLIGLGTAVGEVPTAVGVAGSKAVHAIADLVTALLPKPASTVPPAPTGK